LTELESTKPTKKRSDCIFTRRKVEILVEDSHLSQDLTSLDSRVVIPKMKKPRIGSAAYRLDLRR
jgi:hypothetical protein